MGIRGILFSFHKINLIIMSLYLASMGCGEYKSSRSAASDDIEISFGLARGVFYQDDQVYEKELVFRDVEGQAVFEGDIVLGKVDEGFSKVLVFDLPSVKDGSSDFSQYGDEGTLAFGLQGESLFVYDLNNPDVSIPIQESGASELAGVTLDQSYNSVTQYERCKQLRFRFCGPPINQLKILPSVLLGATSNDQRFRRSMCEMFGINCNRTPRR